MLAVSHVGVEGEGIWRRREQGDGDHRGARSERDGGYAWGGVDGRRAKRVGVADGRRLKDTYKVEQYPLICVPEYRVLICRYVEGYSGLLRYTCDGYNAHSSASFVLLSMVRCVV